MLTEREYEQLKITIDAMSGYNLNGTQYVPAQSVKAILARWTEFKKEIRATTGGVVTGDETFQIKDN